MTEPSGESGGGDGTASLVVGARVRVYPGSEHEDRGVVLEDFGEMPYSTVEVGLTHIADAARRFAVRLDTGGLVFVDSDQIVPE